MELSYEKSETKKFYEKLPVSNQDREWLKYCAQEIFGLFGLKSDNLKFDGKRYFLEGKFYGFTFKPSESVAANIFAAAHLQTFNNDPRSQLSTFSQYFCLIHPHDLSKIEYIFSDQDDEQVAFRLESKSIYLALIQIFCLISFNLRNGARVFTLDLGKIKKEKQIDYKGISGNLRRILCLVFNGGIAKNLNQSISFSGLDCPGPFWTDKGNGLLELNLELLDILGISRLFSVFAAIWREIATKNQISCPWPIEFIPQEIIDFEASLSLKDRNFATKIIKFDRYNWVSMSLNSCCAPGCCL